LAVVSICQYVKKVILAYFRAGYVVAVAVVKKAMTIMKPKLILVQITMSEMHCCIYKRQGMTQCANLGGIMCSNSQLYLAVPLFLIAELMTVEAKAVLLVCCARLLPTHVWVNTRIIALIVGVEFTVQFGVAKVRGSTWILVVERPLTISSLPLGRRVSRVPTMSCL
jgi:hypothetical protein